MHLLNLWLTSTFFQYNGKHYKQLYGPAMGSPVSVVLTVIMQNIEEQALATNTRTIPLLLRYVDDTLTAVHICEIDDFHERHNRWPCSLSLLVSYSYYQVLVHKVNDWSDEVSDWEKLESDVSIAAQIRADSVNPSMVFVVGDGKTYDGYKNKQLSDGQKYKIYSRGLALRVTKVARLTVVVDISLCDNRLFLRPHLELKFG